MRIQRMPINATISITTYSGVLVINTYLWGHGIVRNEQNDDYSELCEKFWTLRDECHSGLSVSFGEASAETQNPVRSKQWLFRTFSLTESRRRGGFGQNGLFCLTSIQ